MKNTNFLDREDQRENELCLKIEIGGENGHYIN